jgi:putative FmdB family regulatory protein
MPIHAYECKNCGYQFDQLYMPQVIEVEVPEHPECEKCKSIETSRQISATVTIYKGEGWDVCTRRAKTFKHDPYECVNSAGEPVTKKGEPL